MIRFFLNRELSKKFKINLAKWKRWSREFLPPDPLGGMQSGFARQYSVKNAFTVFLGGHLVADLKFPIPEAKQILEDLSEWLTDKGFYVSYDHSAHPEFQLEELVQSYRIFITKKIHAKDEGFGFIYRIHGIISEEAAKYDTFDVQRAYYTETLLDPQPKQKGTPDVKSTKLLNITAILQYVNEKLLAPEKRK